MEFVFLLVLVTLGITAFQDCTSRLVSVWLFPVMAGAAAYWHYMQLGYIAVLVHGSINCLLVFSSCLVLWFYAKGRGLLFINHSFGLGDLLFLLVFGLLFPTQTFLILWFFGTLLSLLLGHLLKQKKIPYAGYLALFNILFLGWDYLIPSFQIYHL
ncbi:hypothetical protein OAC51_07460 [Flavobacteriaceae bacterium]|nr:hypothetical protein [Flavobacteriaceae bacterium]